MIEFQWSPEIEFLIDTGYSGSILLNSEIFQLLNYDQISLPEKYWNTAETITGEILKMPLTKTRFKIKHIELDVFVESHELIQENLVGRSFLDNFLTLLDGQQEQISLWEFQES